MQVCRESFAGFSMQALKTTSHCILIEEQVPWMTARYEDDKVSKTLRLPQDCWFLPLRMH